MTKLNSIMTLRVLVRSKELDATLWRFDNVIPRWRYDEVEFRHNDASYRQIECQDQRLWLSQANDEIATRMGYDDVAFRHDELGSRHIEKFSNDLRLDRIGAKMG